MVESGMYQRRPDDVIALQIPFFNRMSFDEVCRAIQEITAFFPRGYKIEHYQNTIKIIHRKDGEQVSTEAKCGDVLIKRIGDETNWGIWPELTFIKFYEPMNKHIPRNGEITW